MCVYIYFLRITLVKKKTHTQQIEKEIVEDHLTVTKETSKRRNEKLNHQNVTVTVFKIILYVTKNKIKIKGLQIMIMWDLS